MLLRGCRSAGRVVPRGGRWCGGAAIKVPPDLACSLRDVEHRFMALQLQDALQALNKDRISREEFYAHSGRVGLSLDSAKTAMNALESIGAVVWRGHPKKINIADSILLTQIVHVVDNIVHLRPVALADEMNERLGLPKADPFPELTREIERLQAEFDELTADKDAADDVVAENRKRFWAMVAVASAAQMWGFAFLTFDSFSDELCWGWDDVEPMCWFVTQAYVVLWFGWMYWKKREHTLEAYDEFRLHGVSKTMYDRRGVDIARWLQLKSLLREKKAERAELTARWL